MKILYINRQKSDYLQDILYAGLVKTLGMANVIEMPWNNKFHLNFKKYPRNIGLCKHTFIKSLLNRFFSNQFSMVIVASCHPETLQLYLNTIHKIPASVSTVFIDGGDWAEVAGDLDRLGGRALYEKILSIRPFDFIFKREYIIDKDYDSNVYPLPFGFNFDRLPAFDKNYKYDVSFWAVESHPVRKTALELLQDRFDCRENGTVKSQVMSKYKRKGSFYLQELARCKIVLNLRGAGWDTLRYWEVPALGGFMISQKPEILIKNNFIDGKEVVFCSSDMSDLLDLCKYFLKHESAREKIAAKGLDKIKRFHMDVHRAQEVLRVTKFVS